MIAPLRNYSIFSHPFGKINTKWRSCSICAEMVLGIFCDSLEKTHALYVIASFWNIYMIMYVNINVCICAKPCSYIFKVRFYLVFLDFEFHTIFLNWP